MKVEQVFKISYFHDLVIFGTGQSVENYLSFSENPPEPCENLFLVTYPGGTTLPKKIIGNLIFLHEDDGHYILSTHPGLEWSTGSPVLNTQGQLVERYLLLHTICSE